MSVLSKHFYVALSSRTCRDIVHPHTDSCLLAALTYFFQPVSSTMKFFLPLFMISLAAKKDNFDRKMLPEIVNSFIGCISVGVLTGSIGRMFMCALYQLFNQHGFYIYCAIPGFIGALSVFLAPNKIGVMFAHSALVMVMGVLIKRHGNIFFKSIDRLRWFRTLVFMSLSAIIMDSLRCVKPEISWFIQPVRYKSKRRYDGYDESPIFDSIIPVGENVCSHKTSCDSFVLNELRTFFKIGMAIELVRSAIKHFDIVKGNVLVGIWTIIRKFNWKFVMFAAGYPSCYRICTCLLNRLYGFETKLANLVSAFLAGIFFYTYPERSFLSYAFACAIEIVWQRYQKSKRSKGSILRKIHKFPLARLSYPFFMMFLFHIRSFYPWQTPSVVMKLMNLVSASHVDEMLLNTYSFLIPPPN